MSKNLIIGMAVLLIAIIIFMVAIIMKIIAKKGKLITEKDFITESLQKQKMKLMSKKAGIGVGTYFVMLIGFPIVIWVVIFLVMKNAYFASIFCVAGVFIPNIIIGMTQEKNAQKFDERFAKALSQLASGLRAGQTIPQAIEDISVSQYINEDIRFEFAYMSAGLRLNKTVAQVFEEFAIRINNEDAKDLASAVKLQAKIGGKEAETVAQVSKNITDRIAERKKIKTLFAETKTTVVLMDFIPFLIMIFLFIAASSFMEYYTKSVAGMVTLGAIVVFMLFGSVLTRVMINVGGKIK